MQGALSMVLALSLPLDLPGRDLIVTLTVGVVLLSILLQGLATPFLMRRLPRRDFEVNIQGHSTVGKG